MKNKLFAKIYWVLASCICLSMNVHGQSFLGQDSTNRAISTAAPFLMIAPDSRASGMGDVGAATAPDPNSVHWNIGKLVFIEQDMGASVSLSPWLRSLVDDMYIGYLSGFYKLSKEQTVAVSMRYFDLGELRQTFDNNGQPVLGNTFRPREYTFSGSYSRKLTNNFGLGVTLKYIASNLTGGLQFSSDIDVGNSVAGDIGVYYRNPEMVIGGRNSSLALGGAITNLGTKMTYTNEDESQFIPTNLRLGGALRSELDPFNSFTFALDFNKLMVPSPPVYEYDENGNIVGIARGQDPNRTLLSGVFGSFADAPDGFTEELKEISISAGFEYWYNDIFAARVGYFYEHEDKGDRNYFTAGLGFRYSLTGIDFSYLVPAERQNPLAETLRLTLFFLFDQQDTTDESVQD